MNDRRACSTGVTVRRRPGRPRVCRVCKVYGPGEGGAAGGVHGGGAGRVPGRQLLARHLGVAAPRRAAGSQVRVPEPWQVPVRSVGHRAIGRTHSAMQLTAGLCQAGRWTVVWGRHQAGVLRLCCGCYHPFARRLTQSSHAVMRAGLICGGFATSGGSTRTPS
jgi:hypothetical protein